MSVTYSTETCKPAVNLLNDNLAGATADEAQPIGH